MITKHKDRLRHENADSDARIARVMELEFGDDLVLALRHIVTFSEDAGVSISMVANYLYYRFDQIGAGWSKEKKALEAELEALKSAGSK